MSVDSDARRQAILFEVAAVATRYEQDEAPGGERVRCGDLRAMLDHLELTVAVRGGPLPVFQAEVRKAAVRELAGRCVAWLEHLSENEAKA